MKFSPIQKNALNMMKPVHSLNAVVFVHQLVDKTFKVEISRTSLAEEIHKIFSQIFLVVEVVVVHAKVKIYRLKQRLLFVNQSLEQI